MRSEMRLLLSGAVMMALLAGCDRQSGPSGQDNATPTASGEATGNGAAGEEGDETFRIDRSKAGAPAPDFPFSGPDGQKTLQDFAGRPLIVNLWATWCAPCIAEMPTLDRVAEIYAKDGLAVLTISQDSQGAKLVEPFFAKHDLPHLQPWVDAENEFGFHYATGLLPTTVLYDSDGKEVARVIGAMDWEGKEAQALIAELL